MSVPPTWKVTEGVPGIPGMIIGGRAMVTGKDRPPKKSPYIFTATVEPPNARPLSGGSVGSGSGGVGAGDGGVGAGASGGRAVGGSGNGGRVG
jgi:hypothetical protein